MATKQPKENYALAGKLHLVDLAGSERLKKSESSGIRMEEALHINKSLTALGKVIVSLDPAQTNAHVPYRDSKLTRLLQNALGGDSYTSVLATIRPTRSHAEECLSTLQFANRCRKVANNPRVHRVGETDAQTNKAKDEVITRLKMEIERLKEFTQKLKQRLAQATGMNLEEMDSSDLGGTDLGGRGYDPAQTQAAVSGAVLAALRAAGVTGASIDDSTGGVRLSDGRVLEGTLPGAFWGRSPEANQQQSRKGQLHRGSAVVNTIVSRIAKAMGYTSAQDVPQALIAVLAEREDEFQVLKRKFETAQGETESLRKEVELAKRQIMSAALGVQRVESASKHKARSISKQMEEQILALEKKHSQQLQALVQENNQIIEETLREKQAATGPDDRLQQANVKIKKIKITEVSRRMVAACDAVQRAEGRAIGSEVSIANLKEQYEYWLNRKDRDSARFIAQLNVYRTRKNAQLKAAEGELVGLWDAVVQYTRVLNRVRQGKYPLQQLRSNVTAPIIPISDLPPLVDHLVIDRLPATMRAKLKQQRCQPISEQNENGLSNACLYGVTKPCSPWAKSQTSTLITGKHSQSNCEHAIDHSQDLPSVELQEELAQTRLKLHHFETKFEQMVRDRTRTELSAHETVQHMRYLEESKQAAHARASEHAQQYATLRIAYEAQRRTCAYSPRKY